MDHDNITIRRNKTSKFSSNESFTSTYSDELARSLPDLSTRTMTAEEVMELKEEITRLNTELTIANNEIDNLLMENSLLKKKTVEQENIIHQYKKIYIELPDSSKICKSSTKKRKKAYREKNLNQHNLDSSFSDLRTKNHLNPTTDGVPGTEKSSKWTTSNTETKLNYNNKLCENKSACKNDTPCDEVEKRPEILILGANQCVGLASKLISSRLNTNYEKYDISSVLKPYATSDEILKSCNVIQNREDNYIVLCIGENDRNPYNVVLELIEICKKMNKINILLLNINRNKLLNVFMLNNLLRNACNKFSNCTFLNVVLPSKYYTRKYYLSEVCKKINFNLDMHFYNKTYLVSKKSDNLGFKECLKNVRPIIKKGTILYYFQPIGKPGNKVSTNTLDLNSFLS